MHFSHMKSLVLGFGFIWALLLLALIWVSPRNGLWQLAVLVFGVIPNIVGLVKGLRMARRRKRYSAAGVGDRLIPLHHYAGTVDAVGNLVHRPPTSDRGFAAAVGGREAVLFTLVEERLLRSREGEAFWNDVKKEIAVVPTAHIREIAVARPGRDDVEEARAEARVGDMAANLIVGALTGTRVSTAVTEARLLVAFSDGAGERVMVFAFTERSGKKDILEVALPHYPEAAALLHHEVFGDVGSPA